MIDTLPEELKSQILQKLPIKNLFQCSLLSKAWHFLIKSPSFISAHPCHPKNIKSTNPNLLLLHRYPENESDKISLHFDNEEFNEYFPLNSHPVPEYSILAGSCNGLICFHDYYGDSPALWNPLIRKSINLPKPKFVYRDHSFNLVGFGLGYANNDFIVLRMVFNREERIIEAELYSINSGTWKTLNCIPQYEVPSNFLGDRQLSTFANGSFHWIAYDKRHDNGKCLILAFDITSENFHEIMLPTCLVSNLPDVLHVKPYGDSSIAVIQYIKNNIWVMKEYGVHGSWTKLPSFTSREVYKTVIGFRKNGEVMVHYPFGYGERDMDYTGHIESFDFGSQLSEVLERDLGVGGGATVFQYVESLALIDEGHFVGDGAATF